MSKTYNLKYFFSRLNKIRMLISQVNGYKTIEQMYIARDDTFDIHNVKSLQGREQ